MPLPYRTLLAILVAAGLSTSQSALGAPAAKSSTFKCWTNSEGVRECGNAVPAEYSQQKTQTVNRQGITVAEPTKKTKNPAGEGKTVSAEEASTSPGQKQTDRMILAMFASEGEITAARDRKVSALQHNIDITKETISKLELKVVGYRKQISDLEKARKPVPAVVRDDMAVENKKLENKHAFVAAKNGEIDAIKAEYENYLVRFRELTK